MAEFPTTRLSMVRAAAGGTSAQSREALADLCRIYWHPLYSYVRRHGYDADQAQDLTQGFIARLLEKNALRNFQQERGRFRSFLLASLKHFLANARDAGEAQKRGGGLTPVGLEGTPEPHDDLTPEKIFEKQWALGLLDRVQTRLREEFVRGGKSEQFDRLRGYLTGDDNVLAYRDLAGEMGLSEGAIKVAIHRLRHRFHEALREEISLTVVDAGDIGDEIRYLMGVIRS